MYYSKRNPIQVGEKYFFASDPKDAHRKRDLTVEEINTMQFAFSGYDYLEEGVKRHNRLFNKHLEVCVGEAQENIAPSRHNYQRVGHDAWRGKLTSGRKYTIMKTGEFQFDIFLKGDLTASGRSIEDAINNLVLYLVEDAQ